MRLTLQWVGVVLVTAAIDLFVRFGGLADADFTRVLWVEAFLFPLAGLALHLVFRSHPRPSGFKRRLQVIAVWGFFLAGLRVGVWAAGFPVVAANLTVLLVAVLAWIGFRIVKRRSPSQRPIQ